MRQKKKVRQTANTHTQHLLVNTSKFISAALVFQYNQHSMQNKDINVKITLNYDFGSGSFSTAELCYYTARTVTRDSQEISAENGISLVLCYATPTHSNNGNPILTTKLLVHSYSVLQSMSSFMTGKNTQSH